jgi:CHAT domain-containing protein
VDLEGYLDTALLHWLPDAGTGARGEGLVARQALDLLALKLANQLSDHWLDDTLREADAHPASWAGFNDLRRAIERNASGQPQHALTFARRAASGFAAAPNQPAWLRAKLEEVYAIHRLVNGRDCYKESVALQKELRARSYTWIEIQAALELSVCATMLGDFAAARAPLRHARELSASSYENLSIRAVGLEAALETVSGNAAVAWSMDRAGLAQCFSAGCLPQRRYQFYSDLSFIAQRSERWRLATAFADEGDRLISTTSNQSMTAMATYRHAMLASAAGLTVEAASAFALASQRFAEIPQDGADPIYRAEGEVSRATIEVSQGNLTQAKEHLQNASAWIEHIADVPVLLRYYQTLGLVALDEGKVDEAEKAFQKAIAVSRAGFSFGGTASQRASWAEETARIYKGLTQLVLRQRNQPAEALRIWDEYRASILRPGATLRIPTAGFSSASGSLSVVLTYAVFPTGVAIWLFDRGHLHHDWIDVSETELKAVADRFAEECADPASPSSALRRDGQWLYRRLIRPVEALLPPGASILLEPDGAISQVPFTALAGPSGRYFGGEHAISISLGPAPPLPSLPVTSRSRALVVGSPALSGDWTQNFPPLPDAVREARTVAGLFSRPTLLLSSEASYSAIRKELPGVDVFHFAGHAISDWSGGALLLADPPGAASLGAAEIETMPLRRCRLAVLSACTTAAGDGAAHVEGLAGAFLRAGARQVVAVRWRVDSSAARGYTETLYRSVLSGVPLERALHGAASALRERPDTSHPSFWAGFELYQAASPWILANR